MLISAISWFRRRGIFFKFSSIGLLAVILFLVSLKVSDPDSNGPLRNNIVVFSLVYLNVIFLSILAFLIGRNVVKLIFDRKNNILGARLRTRLVVAFAGLALVTNVILFVFAGGLLNNALAQFFSVQIEDAVTGAVDVGRMHYNYLKEQVILSTSRISRKITENPEFYSQEKLSSPARLESIRRRLEQFREQENIFSIALFNQKLEPIIKVEHAIAAVDSFKEPDVDHKALRRVLKGSSEVLFEEQDAQSFIRSYELINFSSEKLLLVVAFRIQPEVSDALGRVNDTFREYKQTKSFRQPLRSGYILSLSLITAVILFAAIWFGFYISKQLTTPIQQLAVATARVTKGDYDTFIDTIGDDEFGYLAQSFNRMTAELKTTRDEVTRRGQFIETILARLGVAVIALNRDRKIIQMNESSERLFTEGKKINLPIDLSKVIVDPTLLKIIPLLSALEEEEQAGASAIIREAEIKHLVMGEEKQLVCTVGALNAESGLRIGSIILFDDITEITKAQSMAVWREVARRIAHEIKNPLTPIKLSAQRLTKLVKGADSSEAMIECANAIVENVDSIARLASEFSSFARMPTVEVEEVSINKLCQDLINVYQKNRPEFNYVCDLDSNIPTMQLDPEQIKRAIINLLDNAIEAFNHAETKIHNPKISIVTRHDPKAHQVTLEVLDNGPGISQSYKSRIFDPYFTTKKEGTGIGLGIVLSIIADHSGTIRVFDNKPESGQKGARFVITLPTEVVTKRKLQG